MSNPLSLFFVVFTQSATEKKIRLRADSIKGMVDNTRGSMDVYTDLVDSSGGSEVFTVAEDQEYVLNCLREAYQQGRKK